MPLSNFLPTSASTILPACARVSMEVPLGFITKLWSLISFLPVFFLLLLLGIIKAVVIGPVAAIAILVGNSVVIIGLLPAHVIWTYYCVIKTKRLGLVLKILLAVFLPIPLCFWPAFGILGSLLVGVGYGFFAPLIATFDAVGEHAIDKFYHCFVDGCWSTIEGACTMVQDFTDICFHAYFSFMDDLSEKVAEDEKPLDIKLLMLPSCVLVCLLAVPVDVLAITGIALWKSPCFLFKGWQRLFHDLIGREGPFLEAVCVPFAGLCILLWPIAVVGSVVAAFLCSFFLGLYGGVVVHQENSLRMGLAYIVSVVSMFDEYTNDLLYLREGTCIPRPKYRKTKAHPSGDSIRKKDTDQSRNGNTIQGSDRNKLVSQRSRTLKKAIHQLKPIQIWDWLFRSCELNGRMLIDEGLLCMEDIEEYIVKGKCKKLSIKLPAWCILQCLFRSAKSDSYGLLISDEVELTSFNWPKDKVLEWFLRPLLVMKEQIKVLQLDEIEESCLRKLIMTMNNEKPEEWDDTGFPSDHNVRRAQLQAIIRRLQGIVASMTRIPTFRRRFNNLVKALYMQMSKPGTLSQTGGITESRGRILRFIDSRDDQESGSSRADDSNDIV